MIAGIVFLIVTLLSICLVIKGIKTFRDPLAILSPITFFFLAFILFTFGVSVFFGLGIQWSTGEKKLTGYVYAAEDRIGDKTKGHLRYSLNAGSDDQPTFCVKKVDGQMIKDLAGSGKKVEVIIPTGFVLADFWNCGIPAQVKIVEEPHYQ